MNYIINYNSIPSLENIAIVNLAIELCTQHDVKDEILQFSLQFDLRNKEISSIIRMKSFKLLENRIIEKLFLLPLPNLLKERVANIIQPIELQVIDWVRQFKNEKFIDSICWTVEGCVNKVKTLQKLIAKYSKKYADILYPLACKYCLENHILYLYHKLPENSQNSLSGKRFSEEYDYHLILYWTSFVNNKLATLIYKINSNDYKKVYNSSHSIFRNMFSLAISENNSVAVQYFWKKLTKEEKSNVGQWVNIVLNNEMKTPYQTTNESANILFFILSQLNHDEQRQVIQSYSSVILHTLFLYWPWQTFLLPTLHSMWEYLDEKAYIQFLSLIVNKIGEGKTTEKLFRNIWNNTPNNLKTCFVKEIINDEWFGRYVLCKFLAAKDLETVKIILYNASVEEKNRIIFTLVRSEKFLNLIDESNLNFLDTFMQNILTESDIFNLKTTFIIAHGNTLCHKWICDDNWDMIETFFSWAFTSKDEINSFKNNILNKTQITYAILCKGNFELTDKFMSWCFESKEDIEQFKKSFALSKLKIVRIGYKDWQLFEKIIKWCFRFDEDINEFKFKILESHDTVFDRIVYKYNFEFVDKVIKWCTHSDEECKQFKE